MHITSNKPAGTVELLIVDQRDRDFISNMKLTVRRGETLKYRGYKEILNKSLQASQLEIRFTMHHNVSGTLRGHNLKDDLLLRELRPMMLGPRGGIIYRKTIGVGRTKGAIISLGICRVCLEPISSLEECRRCTCDSCNTPIIDLRHDRQRGIVSLEDYKKVRRLIRMYGPRKPYL